MNVRELFAVYHPEGWSMHFLTEEDAQSFADNIGTGCPGCEKVVMTEKQYDLLLLKGYLLGDDI